MAGSKVIGVPIPEGLRKAKFPKHLSDMYRETFGILNNQKTKRGSFQVKRNRRLRRAMDNTYIQAQPTSTITFKQYYPCQRDVAPHATTAVLVSIAV